MKFIVFQTKEELGNALGEVFLATIKNNPKAVLGLATGSSPLETYRYIGEHYQEEGASFAKVRTFNLDECLSCSLPGQTYRAFMEENLFSKIDIPSSSTFFPNEETLEVYDKEIEEAGGIDLQLLGIGRNGHIGFNEPFTPFDSATHVVALTESTRQANSRFFHGDLSLVPTHAVTMGIGTIKKSRHIILIANTEDKAVALAKLIKEQEDLSCPVTALINHPRFDIYLTRAAKEAVDSLLSLD